MGAILQRFFKIKLQSEKLSPIKGTPAQRVGIVYAFILNNFHTDHTDNLS